MNNLWLSILVNEQIRRHCDKIKRSKRSGMSLKSADVVQFQEMSEINAMKTLVSHVLILVNL